MKSVEEVRADIPLTKEYIYVDNAATTPTPKPVWEAMVEYFRDYCANIERGAYSLAHKASLKFEEARKKVAELIHAKPEEIVFTRNATEGINFVASGLKWSADDEVVYSNLEHHSNMIPWQRLSKKVGLKLKIVEADKGGLISPAKVQEQLSDKTKLVALIHISNVLGTIQPIAEIGKLVHESGGLLLVDGSQTVGHVPCDIKKLNCDFFAFSGHKGPLGPQGTGVLWVREGLLEELEPPEIGGGTIESVGLLEHVLKKPPQRFDAGTPNIPGVIGLGRAAEYIREISVERIEEQERKLTKHLLDGLKGVEKVTTYGTEDLMVRAGVTSINVGGLNSHEVSIILDENWKILTRSGHHCCMPLMKCLGLEKQGSVRISFHYFNTEEEVDKIVDATSEIAKSLA